MKRQGNMLIMTLVACAILALLLVAAVQVANLGKATQRNQLASLQLEQLYRTAIADGLDLLNGSGERVIVGHCILKDQPIDGQTRSLKVEAVDGRIVTVDATCGLDNGGARYHRVQLLTVPREARLAFTKAKRSVWFGGQVKDVDGRWLENHANDDIVILADGTVTVGGGTALKKTLAGSVLITGWEAENVAAVLHSRLSVEGNLVCTGNLSLRQDLSCKTAWIDGTLTIDEGIRLSAEQVFLGQDVPPEVLERIEGTIYMPNPPKPEQPQEGETSTPLEVFPLPENARPVVDTMWYLMLQQLD